MPSRSPTPSPSESANERGTPGRRRPAATRGRRPPVAHAGTGRPALVGGNAGRCTTGRRTNGAWRATPPPGPAGRRRPPAAAPVCSSVFRRPADGQLQDRDAGGVPGQGVRRPTCRRCKQGERWNGGTASGRGRVDVGRGPVRRRPARVLRDRSGVHGAVVPGAPVAATTAPTGARSTRARPPPAAPTTPRSAPAAGVATRRRRSQRSAA